MTSAPGEPGFVKGARGAGPGFYAAEAAGLAWLQEAESVGGTRIVRVLTPPSTEASGILLERLHPRAADAASAEAFGRSLAATHAAGAKAFGAPPPGHPAGLAHGWIGRQRQSLTPTDTHAWGSFYADQRVQPFVRAAVDAGTMGPGSARIIEQVCERLRAGDFDDGRPPARIHGDLWDGNVVYTADGVVLIDPAAHGGHGETDLAMLALFGTPFLDVVQDAYAQAAGLDADWRGRIGLHQLHPLCVHAVSHGPSYARAAADAARPYC